ncbi:hypothetical protein C5167_003809 [Papaver somniferum]|uniref:Ubiquitin conjugation factor E4 core domain-containing protein n=1 Tax=Papaver somniferum TaxID=3469 RepID=A0A4Y7L5Y2_PAPSO|nr:hypothetical protein C5167_003809 [Papaver somniferum]
MVGKSCRRIQNALAIELACMREHFVEDAMGLLIFVSQIPRALDGFMLWFIFNSFSFEAHQFFLEFLVENLLKLYVHTQLCDKFNIRHNIAKLLGYLWQFCDKFNIRHNIAELLGYLWQVPSHPNALVKIDKEEEKGCI